MTIQSAALLISDFGSEDLFVGEIKAAMWQCQPHLQLVDLTHHVRPCDPQHAGFMLACGLYSQPDGCFVSLVDPDISRPIIFARVGTARVLAVDNGQLTFVADRLKAVRTPVVSDLSSVQPNQTFRGRDIFPHLIGEWLDWESDSDASAARDITVFPDWLCQQPDRHTLEGQILHVDRFGNLITNVPSHTLAGSQWVGSLPSHRITEWHSDYQAGSRNQPFLVAGAHGFVEISLQSGSAAGLLDVSIGTPVRFERIADPS